MSNDPSRLTPFEDLADPALLAGGVPAAVANAAAMERARPGGLFGLLHRTMRGKYAFVIPLMLICGFGAAFVGWKSQRPMYRSEGMVQLEYELPKLLPDHTSYVEAMQMYDEVLQTQCSIITSRRVVDYALSSPKWVATRRGSDPAAVDKFVKELLVLHPSRTQTIQIAFSDHDPIIAATGAQAMVESYEKYYTAIDDRRGNNQMETLMNNEGDLSKQILVLQNELGRMAKDYGGTNLSTLYSSKVSENASLRSRLNQAKLEQQLMETKTDSMAAIDNLTPQQIGMVDGDMREKLSQRTTTERQLQQLLSTYGDKNPRVMEARSALEQLNGDIQEYARQFRELQKRIAQNGGAMGNGNMGLFNGSKESVKAEVESLQRVYNETQKEMTTLGALLSEIKIREEKIAQLKTDRDKVDRQLVLFKLEHKLGGRMNVITYGEVPIYPAKDRRLPMAAGLGIAGMSLPLVLVITLSGLSRRYRFSDDAENARGMPPLLGILPALPDKLSDPEQAAIAAHSIHQLRIMLQVNDHPGQQPQRKVYMITSSGSGEGKTSLTMALGLSFAASGSRTLIIDCDMVGQGLTHRLKARQSPGLLEALSAGSLQGRVKKTTTQNLYILPIGSAEASHAGSLSPIGIRKVLSEAKRVFDAVVIDTGPIFGSLEAQSVAPAADGVILTVARGQLQSLVERSVRLLQSVGANISGMVFNRAEQRDFHRSVSSASARSHSAPATPTRKVLLSEDSDRAGFGPLARSVASFLPPTSENRDRPVAQRPSLIDPAGDTVSGTVIDPRPSSSDDDTDS